MTTIKLIFRNVWKNIRDYMIYFLTLMLSVSLFYSFNSIQSQPALKELDVTRKLLSDQLGVWISVMSVIVAVVLAFLIVYANQFLLKRRKKELGIYILLGMEKQKISWIFVGETICIGILSLISGLLVGILLSQGLSLFSLRLFAIELTGFEVIFSISALKKTIGCFVLIFIIVILFNVRTVSKVKLIELFTASRKNETLFVKNKKIHVFLLCLAVICIAASGCLIHWYGILPSRDNAWFQVAAVLTAVGTILLFFSGTAVIFLTVQNNKNIYLKKLNTFLCRQIGSKIQTNFISLAIVCGLLTVTICGVSVGVSTAVTMNEASKTALTFDLNVVADIELAGDTDVVEYLLTKEVDMEAYAQIMEQISFYEADMTYGDLFEGQKVKLWQLDEELPNCKVSLISLSDFNRSMVMQGKEEIQLGENEFLLNCNYEGTFRYIDNFLRGHDTITINGCHLQAASKEVLQETYWMTSIGNNDRGTFIVPDYVVALLEKDINCLLVQYKEDIDANEVLSKMLPIGLEKEIEGYGYTEKSMLNSIYYGVTAIPVFLCCYIGLIFLLICAAILALKQLTETADNIQRYGLLQKLGADEKALNSALFRQIMIFFVAPLVVAGVFSAFTIRKVIVIIEEFMNMHIATNIGYTVGMFLVVYGGYFLATYLTCKRMVAEN